MNSVVLLCALVRRQLPVGLLSLLILTGYGCSLRPSLPPLVVAEEQLLAAVAEQQNQFSSLRGMAKVEIVTADESLRTSQLILVANPDRFRVEVLSLLFGPPLLSLAVDGSEMAVSIPSNRQFYRGPATAKNLSRFTRVPLGSHVLIPLLLHQVPLIGYQQARSEPGPKLFLDDADGNHQHLEFDRQLRLVGVTYLDGWRPTLTVKYSEFDATGSGFPLRLEVFLPQSEIHATIELSELEVNPQLADDKFRLLAPEGIPVLPLSR